MAKKHVSLKDLALELDVSISTVSRALKNHPDISPDLTKKIQLLAEEKNYTPNPLAMGLLRQQTKMIGVIIPDIVTHFYSSIISGIEAVAKKNGYFIIIASSYESYEKEVEIVKNLLKTRVEGLIICLSQETNDYHHFDQLIKNEIPLVFFDRVCRLDEVPCVLADSFDAARKITKHFFDNGCRRIAFISGPEHLNISQNRLSGYTEGLKEVGLTFDPCLVEECNLSAVDATLATQKILVQKPDAIFGLNDTIVFAAMKEVKKQGLKIPDDVALVGFTDEFHSTVVDPQLTSVSHPTFEMGVKAAELFFELIQNEKIKPKKIVLGTELIVRESSLKLK